MPAGRPTDYKAEYVQRVAELAANGATDMEIADEFDVSVRTLYSWRAVHPEFLQALKAGKEIADERVERSLFQRATGYEQQTVKIFMPSGADSPIFAPFREVIAPDTTACIFWLKNRKPKEWRDKSELEVPGLASLADVIAKARKRG
jgi:hypothetical protein